MNHAGLRLLLAATVMAAASPRAAAGQAAGLRLAVESGEAGQACLFDANCSGVSQPPPAVRADGPDRGTGLASAPDAAPARRDEASLGAPPVGRTPALSLGSQAAPSGAWAGTKKGSQEGALLGFFAVISPAAALLSEGFSRDMSRAHDGAWSGNGDSTAYKVAGVALGALLYIPALVAGAVGGAFGAAAGSVAETVRPGSTRAWDAEGLLFD